ncbi:ABC transporter permease [Desulfoscipio geothermicus]|uniref:ABC-2 family transporter protein n=1 Tax=Desulfoscipio geothermicus DSM 3669 TaxID=1121426 RepID=A0A1I6E9I5_9FIRM|nr:ABC transporter permease subunit [Desulfoscipio geothermicus]SFR14389.1 ABC-2 family transporter protein [Desulfoscipio geothermicus DSM 3669]
MSALTGGIKTGWKEYWAGLRNGLAPMLGKEMRSRTRGWRSPALLSVYLGLLSAGTVAFLWLNLQQVGNIYPQVGLSLYGIMVFGLVLLLAFIAPAVSAGAISGERERRTYDLLLVTRASLTGIVLGKWLASIVYLLFLVLAALPVLAVVFLYGGVPPATVMMAVLLCMITGLGYGALGICLSAVLRRSQAATIVSLVLVFILIFGTPIVAGIAAARDNYDERPVPYGDPDDYRPPAIPWYVFMSPLSAMTDAMPDTGNINTGRGIPLISSVMNELMRQFQPREMREYAMKMGYSTGYVPSGAATGEEKPGGPAAWPFWARFALNQAVLALVSLVVAVLAITPRKPWVRLKRI